MKFTFPKEARQGDFIYINGKIYIPIFHVIDNISRMPVKGSELLLVREWIK